MTEQEQWDQINYPSFFGAIGDRIVAAEGAMENAVVALADSQAWLETQVNQVPIYWRRIGEDCELKIGAKGNKEPFYQFTIPYQWLAA